MRKILFMLIFSATIFTSCKKGDVGPAGTNANIITLAEVTPSYEDWIFHPETYGGEYRAELQADMITQEIIDNTAVLGYIETSKGIWEPLPYDNISAGVGVLQYTLTPGRIHLSVYNTVVSPFLFKYRFIAIPLK